MNFNLFEWATFILFGGFVIGLMIWLHDLIFYGKSKK